MKKSLVALAVLAATGAYAQSSVTLYGIVEATTDIGYNRNVDIRTTTNTFTPSGVAVSSGTTATSARQKNNFRVQDGSDQGTGTSRVGFRGTEDLGGGLKANFVLEMGLRSDDGCTTLGAVTTTTISGTGAPTATSATACNNGGGSAESGGSTFGRNAWGGLSGGFGEVRVGRQVLGSYGVQANSEPTGASLGLYNSSATQSLPMGGVRFSNAIKYLSPNFGGFTANVTLAAPETGANTFTAPANNTASRRTGVDLALEYANGPAYIGFGYNKRDAGNITSVTTGVSTVGVSPGVVNAYTVGGSYDLGVVKPFINYTRQTTDVAGSTVAPVGSATASNASNANARALSVGLRAPVGPFTVIAGFGRVNADTTGSTVATTAGGVTTLTSTTQDNRRDSFQLGAQYALSKRTLVEANYGYAKLRGNGSSVATSPAGRTDTFTLSNDRVSALNVGLKHSF